VNLAALAALGNARPATALSTINRATLPPCTGRESTR
jgi:hypothetical protein